MLENNSENNSPIKPSKKFFTVQARRAHVRAYQASGETMVMYCDKHSLFFSTFKGWVTRYGDKKIPAAFVPMVMTPKNSSSEVGKSKSLQRVEIHASGIKIVFPEIPDIETFIQLIRGISDANTTESTNGIVFQ